MTYIMDQQKLSVKYHADTMRILFATRNYFKLGQGEGGGDDDVDWNIKHHAVFHVINLSVA